MKNEGSVAKLESWDEKKFVRYEYQTPSLMVLCDEAMIAKLATSPIEVSDDRGPTLS